MVNAIRIDEIKNKIFYELQLGKVFNIPFLTLLETWILVFYQNRGSNFFMIYGYSKYRNNVCVDCLTLKNLVGFIHGRWWGWFYGVHFCNTPFLHNIRQKRKHHRKVDEWSFTRT